MAEALVRQQQLVSLPKRPRHYDHDEDVNDIIVEILSRLPVKSLLRFRSVCKSWRALISDSYFVKKHLGHAVTDTSNSSRLLNLLYTSPRIVDLQGLEDHDHIRQRDAFADDILDRSRIFGSCNGLICLQATMFHGLYCDDIFLWNPSTRVAKKVPEHNFTKGSISIHGFGYDSTTDDYKLILGARNKVAKKTKIAIFTVKTGSRRTVQDFEFVHYLNGQGCFVNGALHWLDSMYKSTRIVSFDLAEEKCDTLCRIEYGPMFRMGIGTIRNCLCYYTYSSIRSMPMTIWMMNEYGINKPWTKLMNIPTNIIPYKIYLRPKHVVENGEVLMILDGKDFVIYNPKENKYRTVFQSPTILQSAAVVVYLDTLVSPEFGS
ncbi:F-box/kelch-repeat protein At3g23880-like [Rosa rugosa]|uniref:F-box/kelch-repeat protein At3g23880-like n=1 Tax=Rosa rugosa TaxID=74645 RepID=UPI002B40FE8F|nr:F-box/kelch-repeat protein At3g23880-like [Rosa rugosa]